VEWKEGRLSVSAEGAPLSRVLHEVARRIGMEICGLEGLHEPVSVHFAALPLQEGLQQLSLNSLIVWKTFPQRAAQPVRAIVFGKRTPSPRGALLRRAMPSEEGPKVQGESGMEEEQDERLKALHTFAQQSNEAALQQALFDPDPTIQEAAFTLLAEQDHQRAIAALVDATTSDQPEVRLQALHLLHQTDQVDEETVSSALGAALADADPTVKEAAIQALADRGGADTLGALRQAFHDPDPSIRILALEHAAQQDQGLPLLQEALADEDEIVRSVAFSRLQQAIAERR
jgi:HEAT repeat protein